MQKMTSYAVQRKSSPGCCCPVGAAMSLSLSQSFGGGDYKTVGGVSYRVSRVRVICMQEGSWIVDIASPDQVCFQSVAV